MGKSYRAETEKDDRNEKKEIKTNRSIRMLPSTLANRTASNIFPFSQIKLNLASLSSVVKSHSSKLKITFSFV